ncbi:MAG TPA: lamin tail domain-containing protein [Candidatus Eisenbacteria bacterium]|jgi:hypothetical protein
MAVRIWSRVAGCVAAAGFWLAQPPVTAAAAAPAAGADLKLSEFLPSPARDWSGDGATDARADEWVEVVNAGAVPLDLGAHRIADGDSTIRIALSGTLPPGSYAVVTGQDALDWQRSEGRAATGLSLNNAGDTVRLFRVEGGDTVQVDAKPYNSIEGGSDRAVGRLDPLVEGSWLLFDALNPYTGPGNPHGTGCPPTPGFANGCTTGVKAETTWGAIKKLYR